MSSMETTLARAAATAAEADWKGHHGQCPRCTRAVRGRQWGDLCRFGAEYRAAHLAAAAELRRNRELDKQPAPDQKALF
jgi:hypothetical protein